MAPGFTNWASQHSPYYSIVPWASYSERNSSNTATDLEANSPSAPKETVPFSLISSGSSCQDFSASSAPRAAQLPPFEQLENRKLIKAEVDRGRGTLLGTVPHNQTADLAPVQINAQFPAAYMSPVNTAFLGTLNLGAVSDSRILYYFGVLATQAQLLPKFHLTRGRKQDRWGVKLTMYGMTFVRSHVYASCKGAKVDVCREALRKLKTQYPEWHVPEPPKESLPSVDRDWVYLLHEYCVQQGLAKPKYTKYEHQRGYRHEVEVDGGMYFGTLKHYPNEHLSEQGSAQLALYDMLVGGVTSETGLQDVSILETSSSSLLALVPREPLRLSLEPHLPGRRKREDHEGSRAVRRRVRKSRSPARFTCVQKSMPRNANMQPLENCRLAAIEVEAPAVEDKRWKVTPLELSYQIRDLESWAAKLEREHTAAAWFKEDPFLSRASPIGKVQNVPGTRNAASEACAERVADFLIKMVEEDSMDSGLIPEKL
ncbi:hypothetical protein BJX64DRAFT_285676 [Aspergillus heterothallicus]